MTPPRISIAAVLFAVLLVSADCALARFVADGYAPYGLIFGLFGILPMAHVLAIACYRALARGTADRPSFLGFAFAGALSVVAWFFFCMSADDRRLMAINTWMVRAMNGLPYVTEVGVSIPSKAGKAAYYGLVTLTFFATLTAVPQLLVALGGRWIGPRLAASLRPDPHRAG